MIDSYEKNFSTFSGTFKFSIFEYLYSHSLHDVKVLELDKMYDFVLCKVITTQNTDNFQSVQLYSSPKEEKKGMVNV